MFVFIEIFGIQFFLKHFVNFKSKNMLMLHFELYKYIHIYMFVLHENLSLFLLFFLHFIINIYTYIHFFFMGMTSSIG